MTDLPNEKPAPRLSPVLVHLLKGVLYQDQEPRVWSDLLDLEARAGEYFQAIGLNLLVDKAGGYAYLKQADLDEEDGLPRLIHRRPLSYMASLLCVLLRKKYAEAEAAGEGGRVVLPRDQIVDMLRLYAAPRSDEALTEDQIEAHVHKAADMGLLKLLKGDPPAYEVRPVVKALVDASWLAAFDDKLKEFLSHADRPA